MILRRLSPNNRKVEAEKEGVSLLTHDMLHAMGLELANVHLGAGDAATPSCATCLAQGRLAARQRGEDGGSGPARLPGIGGAVTQAGGPREACAIDTPHAWLKLLVGFFAVFALFQALGHVLASDHAQAGLLICAAIVAATIGAEAGLFRRPLPAAVHNLGLGRPTARGMLAGRPLWRSCWCCRCMRWRAAPRSRRRPAGWGCCRGCCEDHRRGG